MAIAVQLDFPGGTLDQYDRVIAKMGFQPRGLGAPEGLFHWVAKTDAGLRVVDVWRSREAFDSFARTQIAPITEEMGLAQPQMQFFEVHNYLTTPA